MEQGIAGISPPRGIHQPVGELDSGFAVQLQHHFFGRDAGYLETEQHLVAHDGRRVEIGIISRIAVQVPGQFVDIEFLGFARVAVKRTVERQPQHQRVEHRRDTEHFAARRKIIHVVLGAKRGFRPAENRIPTRSHITVDHSARRERIRLGQVSVDTAQSVQTDLHLLVVGNEIVPELIIHFRTRKQDGCREQQCRCDPSSIRPIHLRVFCCKTPDNDPDILPSFYPGTPEKAFSFHAGNPRSAQQAPASRKLRRPHS